MRSTYANGSVLFALLLFVPLGLGLLAYPVAGERPLLLPMHARPFDVEPGWGAAWLVAPALLSLPVALGCLVAGARAVRRLAPRYLGPTDADRMELALRRGREVARGNTLARDLHDSVGHALTAMTIQATAARVSLPRDTDATLRALSAIEETGRAAVGELDAMLGVLRRGDVPARFEPEDARADGSPPDDGRPHDGRSRSTDIPPMPAAGSEPRLTDLLAARRDAGLETNVDIDPDDVDPLIRRELVQITREALTNAARHGAAPTRLHLARRDDGGVRLDVVNPLPDRPAARPAGGRGLVGIRERALLLGGTAHAGSDGDEWRLVVDLPGAPP